MTIGLGKGRRLHDKRAAEEAIQKRSENIMKAFE